MVNDIERYDFWNREMVDFLKKEKQKKIDLLMRWDSVVNKVPFICQVDPINDNIAVEEVQIYPTTSLSNS